MRRLKIKAIISNNKFSQKFLGGISPIEDEAHKNEILELLNENIEKLEAGTWEIVNIESIGQQVVAGIKYFIHGTYKNKSDNSLFHATITIYSRPWEDFVESKEILFLVISSQNNLLIFLLQSICRIKFKSYKKISS